MTELTVLVVTYNSAPLIGQCLGALAAAGLRDIVVYDNASSDDTLDVIAALGLDVRVIAGPRNLGFGAAMNLAATYAPAVADLLLVNPDCFLNSVALNAMIDCAAGDSVGVCAPGMAYADGQRAIAGGGAPTLTKELLSALGVMHRLPPAVLNAMVGVARRARVGAGLTSYLQTKDGREPVAVDWVSGFCMLIKRACWDGVGGFDERIFMYFEDVALCASARERGWTVISLPNVAALHNESASSTPHAKSRLYAAGMWAYFRHHGTPAQRRVAQLRGTRP